jgi:hypothetical protein
MKKVIMLILFTLILTVYGYAAENDKFYGVLTIDSYPVEKCKIVKIASSIVYSQTFIKSQYADFNDEKNYTSVLHRYIQDLSKAIEKDAVKEGYNVILGFRVVPMLSYSGFGNSVYNNKIGFGLGSIRVSGTPAKIVCR